MADKSETTNPLLAGATTSAAALTVEEMAKRLDCSPASILRAIQNLEAKGLVERVKHDEQFQNDPASGLARRHLYEFCW